MATAAPSKAYVQYNIRVFALSFSVLAAIVIYIIQTTDDYKNSNALVDEAVHWQSVTRGTVGLSSTHLTAFKILSGRSYIDKNKVNTLVLGSSTLMGIRGDMFPEGWKVYNYSKDFNLLNENGNALRRTLGEAYYFVERYDNVKWIIIGLDFSLGMVFENSEIVKYNATGEVKETSFKDKFADAITLARLKITLKNILADQNLSQGEYPCPENDGMGRDFGAVLAPGRCAGFRYDGSATFNYHRMNRAQWQRQSNAEGLSLYIGKLEKSSGKVNESYLNHLRAINDKLMSRSGGLIMLSPPLMPDAEQIILKSAAGRHLKKYKKEMHRWASANQIQFIDAGQSEEYGCVPEEFYDPHHAIDQCYSKIFDRFFKNNRTVR
jgi:hypothetical protein